MSSAHKILLAVITLQLLIGLAQTIHDNPSGIDLTTLSELEDQYAENVDEISGEQGLWGTVYSEAAKYYELTIGNALKWTTIIFKVFFNGINFLSIRPSQVDLAIEQAMVWALIMFRVMLTAVLFLESYLIIKNRKSN